MDLEAIREFCLSLPHVTEKIQWGEHLLFCIGGKMFAILSLEPGTVNILSLKATPEHFAELTTRPDIVPAPYLARGHWIALQSYEALSAAELRAQLRLAYQLIHDKLPKKTRDALAASGSPAQ